MKKWKTESGKWKKEADETRYWLKVLFLSDIISKEEYEPLDKDAAELVAMLTSSIRTIKGKNSNK